MAASLLVYRKGLSLIPADRMAEEDMEKLSTTKPLMVDVRQPRSLPHHRLLFALLRKIAQSTPTPLSEDALLSWIKMKTGHVEFVPLGFGQSYAAPASIAFTKMSQDQFNSFFDEVVNLICSEIVPGIGRPELLSEVEAMIAKK